MISLILCTQVLNRLDELETKIDANHAKIAAIEGDLAGAEASINSNIDAAETAVNANVDGAESSINGNVDDNEAKVGNSVTFM